MSGDYTLEDNVHVLFTTRAFATGVPGTLSASTVAVYEDVTATPILTSVAVTEDLNSIAGLNAVTIAATAANGFNAGGHYHVVIEAGTVDSVSVVGEVVGNFTIGASAAAADLANGTDGLGAIKTDTAAILVDTADMQPKLGTPAADVSADIAAVKVDTAAVLVDTADMQPKLGTPAADVSADIAAVKAETALILTDTGTTLQGELDAIQAAVITNAAGVDIAADIIAMKAETALIVADTNELQTDWADGGRLDLLVDAIKVPTDQMVFTKAGELDSNTLSINGAGLVGDGNATPWDGA